MDVPKILALMVILLLNVQCSQTQGTSECVYAYHEQPPSTLECNPYPNMRLILGCAIQGPSQATITWFWEPLNTRQLQRLSDAKKYGFQLRIVVNRNSWLERRLLQVRRLTDSDAGWYFCQAELSNGTLLTPSNRLFLAVQSLYRRASICQDEAQSSTVPSCARIVNDDSTTASTVGTTPSNPATDSNRGSIDPPSGLPTDGTHRPSLLTDSPSSLPTVNTHHSSLLTTTLTLAPTPTVAAVPNPESDMLQVALYSISAVVVVFCATIVTLGFSIVILICRKKPDHANSKKTAVADQEVGATTRLCACTCMNSGGAESSGDIPMEECVAYGTCEQRRGKGDITVTTGECPAYGVVERQQGIAQHNDNNYDYIETPNIAISSQL